ncbi:MAG: uroporphyrinogen decarboxylase family protein [Armatimonadota bacterium]|nr:uroporphyrinogen decarboxylase family protein [Armatimonadota bacterium]
MTSRERMIAAMEGRPVDMVPVAPYFWGAEYAWKLMGIPIWELIHGPRSIGLEMQEAIIRRHDCDWVLHLHHGSNRMEGKELVKEDEDQVLLRDTTSGKEYIFHKEGHWLLEAGTPNEAKVRKKMIDVDPPSNRAEADDWIKEHFPRLDEPAGEMTPNREEPGHFPDRFNLRCMHPPFADLAYALGFEPTLVLLNDNPSLCAYMAERLMGDVARTSAQLAADGCDGGLMVDSYASADIMSPEAYANWVAPLHKLTSDELHRAGLKSVMYNTGNMLPLLGTVKGMGYDAVSVEERIKGVEMDIAEIRKGLGLDVCIFANFDSYLLLNGDRDKIRAEVSRQLKAGLVGGSRFIMGTGSPICDGAEPEALDLWVSETRAQSRSI